MIHRVEDLVAGRPVVAWGVGDLLDRAMHRTPLRFEYLVSERGEGGEKYGAPIVGPQRLFNERRDVAVFVFDRYLPRVAARLAGQGLRWGRKVFDCRWFGIACPYFDEYEYLKGLAEVEASLSVVVYAGQGAELDIANITIPKREPFVPVSIYVGNGARLSVRDAILESGVVLHAGGGSRVDLAPGCLVRSNTRLSAGTNTRVVLGRDVVLGYESILDAASHTELTIGDGSTFGKRLELFAYAPVRIGSDCMFSSNVYVESGAGHDLVLDGRKSRPKVVPIGDHVWVGMSSTVLAGGALDDGCMVAASSLVNKPFGPRTLLAGQPARAIGQDVSWNRDYTVYKEEYYAAE